MTGKAIMEALTFIDEAYIEEAETGDILDAAKPLYKILIPLAASLCIVLGVNSLDKTGKAESQTMEDPISPEIIQETWIEMNKQEDSCLAEMDIALDESNSPEANMSAVLRIEEWTGDGFTAIVERSDETTGLVSGMILDVTFSPSICIETYADGLVNVTLQIPAEVDFPAGTLVKVRFVNISESRKEIVIKSISLAGQ